MPYTLHCRSCEWAVTEPVSLKGEANLIAGRHIAETGHSVELRRVLPEGAEDDFYRGGEDVEVLGQSSVEPR